MMSKIYEYDELMFEFDSHTKSEYAMIRLPGNDKAYADQVASKIYEYDELMSELAPETKSYADKVMRDLARITYDPMEIRRRASVLCDLSSEKHITPMYRLKLSRILEMIQETLLNTAHFVCTDSNIAFKYFKKNGSWRKLRKNIEKQNNLFIEKLDMLFMLVWSQKALLKEVRAFHRKRSRFESLVALKPFDSEYFYQDPELLAILESALEPVDSSSNGLPHAFTRAHLAVRIIASIPTLKLAPDLLLAKAKNKAKKHKKSHLHASFNIARYALTHAQENGLDKIFLAYQGLSRVHRDLGALEAQAHVMKDSLLEKAKRLDWPLLELCREHVHQTPGEASKWLLEQGVLVRRRVEEDMRQLIVAKKTLYPSEAIHRLSAEDMESLWMLVLSQMRLQKDFEFFKELSALGKAGSLASDSVSSLISDNTNDSKELSAKEEIDTTEESGPEIEAARNHPQLADDYRVLRTIGRGAQGVVYVAKSLKTKQPVAIKALSMRDLDGWKASDLFMREVALLKSMRVHGTPQYLDAIDAINSPAPYFFLVQEFIPGKTLETMLNEGVKFAMQDLIAIALAIILILERLRQYAPPIVHRDIKPSNIMMTPQGKLYLIDFGAAMFNERAAGGSTFAGTAGYMAPEQCHGKSGTESDIYALGATLIHLATGIPPYKMAVKSLKLQFKPHMPKSTPPWFIQLLEAMVMYDPEKRVKNLDRLVEALHGIAGVQFSEDGSQSEIDDAARLMKMKTMTYDRLVPKVVTHPGTLTAVWIASVIIAVFSEIRYVEGIVLLILPLIFTTIGVLAYKLRPQFNDDY